MQSFRNFLNEAALTASEIKKYTWRIDLFLDKFKNKIPFELNNGSSVVLKYPNQDIIDFFENKQTLPKGYKIPLENGKTIQFKDLKKNAEFGGKESGHGTVIEDRELADLNMQIDKLKSEVKKHYIKVYIGNKSYNIIKAETTPGTPKSDFHLVDENGNEVIWISHKAGSLPKDVQQWGGISKRSEPEIFNHKETQKFIQDLKNKFPDGLPRATSVKRPIKDQKLQKMSVYGNQYGKKLGRQNVTMLIQGKVLLKKNKDGFVLSGHRLHLNGEDLSHGYEPVFFARYNNRNDAGVKMARIGIMSLEGRKGDFI